MICLFLPKVSFFAPPIQAPGLSVGSQSQDSVVSVTWSLQTFCPPPPFSDYQWGDLPFIGRRPWLSYPVNSPEPIYELSVTICLHPCTAAWADPSCPLLPRGGSLQNRHFTAPLNRPPLHRLPDLRVKVYLHPCTFSVHAHVLQVQREENTMTWFLLRGQ